MTDPTPTPEQLEELRRALAGQFTVERPLGAGGMGRVYLGRDATLDRPVAIKVVAPELAASTVVRERFLYEARTVARLRHPHIVAVYAAGEARGLLYFVMEYVPGESLRDHLDRTGRLDDGRAAVILRDLARALAYAHEQGIVHRDVKPENILLDRETGRAMLTDFGVARAFAGAEGDGQRTGTGFVLGSPRYMSPEQVSGDRALDGRSDVYALGLVGYEMFAGEPAIGGTSAPGILVKQLTEKPAPLATKSPNVPPGVAAALDRALEKEPDARWPSAGAMADAFDAGLSNGATTGATTLGAFTGATARTTASTPSRPWWRTRAATVAATLAIVVLASLAWAAARGAGGVPRGVNPRKSYLVAPFEVLGADQQQVGWLREGSVSMLSLSLAQWRDLQVVDYERTLDLLRDAKLDGARAVGLEAARDMARRAGVWTVVMGQVSRLGDSLVVSARLFDVASGKKVDQAQRAVAAGADPRPLYDALARDLLDLAGAPSSVALGRLTETTTWSVDAYRAYLEGVRALNAWQLDRADSSFARAIAADSSFALAYYKRAVGMGWRQTGDTAQRLAIKRAVDLSGRLPARERALVVAYADLVAALVDDQRVDTARSNALFRAAQQKYAAAVALDSADAEAWYGLGDAYWHHRPDGWGGPATVGNWSRALAAFNRAVALDSTFYLAYSHQIDIYRQAGGSTPGLVLEGGTLRLLDSTAARAYGPARIARDHQEATRLAMRAGRAWVDADPAPHAYESLAYLFAGAGMPDSAVAVLREAERHPESRSAKMPFAIAAMQTRADPAAALASLRAALRDVDPAALRAQGGSDLFEVLLGAGNAAAVAGNAREVDSVARLTEASVPRSPGTAPLGMAARWWALGTKLAMGVPPQRLRPALDSGTAYIDHLASPIGTGARQQAVAVPYVAYLVTRDPAHLATVRRWRADSGRALVELDALQALAAGDTAAARRATRLFPSVDSARATGAGQSVVRWVARAEVLEALGDARAALATYEGLVPSRFSASGPFDVSWPLYTRSFLARGRLYERLGERAKAADAYRSFLALSAASDGPFDDERREARAALARVQDASGQPVRVGGQ